jgi:hypothetical protein
VVKAFRPTTPPSKEDMEILDAIALWTGWFVWTCFLIMLFLWSIGKFSIVKIKVTEEEDDRKDR